MICQAEIERDPVGWDREREGVWVTVPVTCHPEVLALDLGVAGGAGEGVLVEAADVVGDTVILLV
jgi:hypothetical protein